MNELRALTLHQPWASLVAVGAKTIETRSWPTSYRGPLLIHASKERPPMMWLPPLSRARGPEARARDRQTWHVIDTITAPEHQRPHITDPDHPKRDHIPKWATSPTLFFPSEGSFARPGRPDGIPATEFGSAMVLPLGAVVASCRLVDCVPMVDEFAMPEAPYLRITSCTDGDLLQLRRVDAHDGGSPQEVTDQLPFGDFSPGRWAWLLEDVKPTTKRCPRCWRHHRVLQPIQERTLARAAEMAMPVGTDDPGLLAMGAGELHEVCPTCSESGSCAPVPMRGRQGLWTPNADDWSVAA